ncbi:acetyl/propionyl/methylcrotonyl-CoA carboxylase subunit alpha [Streptomyces spirodelae]|uniref:Acety-l/propionyl-CoA carboxylase subunit alpha n=1 Tax=Streptomyces spirodelae TaxID=2812904 RepID=A0ABS3WUR6_9ACTN|nr:biotin carboxylase N-terminal domain-containing protein [Streptomyces spirodelae]MBO8186606.1 acety-l/propionyl-CoA carboxylase subunit alpha [Streptomyces spirodelae]
MIRTILVANRGEIARRVFRTCRELGIATVAVHSDADAEAPFVREADAAVRLPGSAPADTYLRGDLVVAAALAAGADAVHPGYGFLSENAEFARAVQDAGLTWIGPPPAAIEAMASKTAAKKLLAAAGGGSGAEVPLLEPLDPARVREADLPVLVKAAAGGGGRGMRVVREVTALEGELRAARAEAASAFGDGEVFVEPYIERGRHVEVQVLADAHGGVWVLGTRDCSLQRRHQKVIEEAPAPGLGDEVLRTLERAAVVAARTVGYAGAGTVEFLVSRSGRPFFLEMNTRLQVEHPVTECVYGVDLVAHQIAVAEGASLPAEGPPAAQGHAVEARLYAEDPARDWQPQTGRLWRFQVPGEVRVDAGVTDGCEIGMHYDPMLAKVVAWAPTRAGAIRKLARALESATVHGPVTNRDLLVRSLRHRDFCDLDAGCLDTGFYERNLAELTAPQAASDRESEGARYALVAAALAEAVRDEPGQGRPPRPRVAARSGGWRNVPSAPANRRYVAGDGTEHEVRYLWTRGGVAPEPAAYPGLRAVDVRPDEVVLEVAGVRRRFPVAVHGDRVFVGRHAFTAQPRLAEPEAAAAPGSLLAPMPGTVVRLGQGVAEGAEVVAGQPLLWLEAMKMEHRVVAPTDGRVTALHVAAGHQVEVGAVLAVVTA